MHQDGEEVQPGDENLLIRSDPAGPGAGLQGRVGREQLPADLDAGKLQQEHHPQTTTKKSIQEKEQQQQAWSSW